MNILALQLLGVAQFQRGNQPIEHVPAKAVALLTYLASMRTPQLHERVLDLLWPESMPAAARKHMRNILWRLGESFGDGLFQQSNSPLSLAARWCVHASRQLSLLRHNKCCTPLLYWSHRSRSACYTQPAGRARRRSLVPLMISVQRRF
jgi:hypothetical protein